MDNVTKQLQAKVVDYKRFVMTLLIVSFYFYLGTLITVYLKPVQEGSMILMGLTSVSIIASFYFLFQWKKCKTILAENE